MIRSAQSKDHETLKTLWMDVFGDSRQAVDAYFSLRHTDQDMLVWEENGRVVAMLSMLPLTLANGDQRVHARYIYAVATAPKERAKGIAGLLLERAGEEIIRRGEDAAVLVPATEGLFTYYAKRGFQTAFSLDVVDFAARDLPPRPDGGLVQPCTSAQYARIRDRVYLKSGLYAYWDEKAVSYALSALGDGGAVVFQLGGGEGVACYTRVEGHVLVRELALEGIDVPSALALLHSEIHAPSYRVRLPVGTNPNAQEVPFGMIRWYKDPPIIKTPGYLSLALD